MVLSTNLVNTALAQKSSDSEETSKYVYCELVGTLKFLSAKFNISVDYGQERRFFKDTKMKDEQSRKVGEYNSMVDALNYMADNGWEFVQAYVVTVGDMNVYRWLLRKKKE